MTRRPIDAELAFDSLHLEGALFFSEHLTRIAHGQAEAQSAQDYGIPPGLKLRDEVGRAYRIAQASWQAFTRQRERQDVPAATATQQYAQPLLEQVFGFREFAGAANVQIGEVVYPIHAMAHGCVPLILIPHDLGLDDADPRFGDGGRRRSGFRLLQEFLNASESCLWGLVTNGERLRLLRDNASLTRPAYLEVDFARLFAEESYADFSALWHVLHASRFPRAGQPPEDCILERWRNAAREEGARARDKLRHGVTQALLALGEGFLRHPANNELRRRLTDGGLTQDAYFEQLLRLVYRLIFWFTIEDRGLLHPPQAGEDAKALYHEGYAAAPLRKRALRTTRFDRHEDAWHALRIVFDGLGEGQPALALPALGGLFAADQCPHLDAAELPNRALLQAVRDLAWFRHEQVLTPVNYRAMQSEEFGSVYESLLELTPEIDLTARRFGFPGLDNGGARGSTRKLTGSYYTPDALVQELLRTALDPVVERTTTANPEDPVAALLQLAVLDPAVGSGHFLIAAAHHIADRVARLSAEDGNPAPEDHRRALRQVVSHCLYGVDRNPMALELARTALWLEAFTPEAPLSFIDHHLVCGDALVGLIDFAVLRDGIPKQAFKALTGDDKDGCKALAATNRGELKGWKNAQRHRHLDFNSETACAALEWLDSSADQTLADLAAKREAWERLVAESADSPLANAADLYMAAFLSPKTPGAPVPTTGDMGRALLGDPVPEAMLAHARAVCDEARVLHWPLAFAQVLGRGGFDVVLGNPPWDQLQVDPQEFFASSEPVVAQMTNHSERQRKIETELSEQNPHLYWQYYNEVARVHHLQSFVHAGGRFPLTSFGRINVAPLFAELATQLIGDRARAGVVLPTGIATDSFTQAFFRQISDGKLVALHDFENREAIFPGVHRSYKFCLMTLGTAPEAQFSFFSTNVQQLADERRRFSLSPDDLRRLNPNTGTCPVFRSQADAALTNSIYARVPVLMKEQQQDDQGNVIHEGSNPWGLDFQLMFMMNTASRLFERSPSTTNAALYEAKMIHQFDHRWGSYTAGAEPEIVGCTEAQKSDPGFSARPRYWVDKREVWLKLARLPEGLMKAMKENDTRAVLLCATQILFGGWLADWRRNDAARSVYRNWQDFVQRHPYARNIAPTHLGFCGKNPAELQPLDDNYLPAQGEDRAAVYAPGDRNATAWYAVDPNAEAAILALIHDYRHLPRPEAPLHDESMVLALAEQWLEAACPKWLMGWRDITNATNERTVIAAVVPRAAVGNNLPLLLPSAGFRPSVSCALLGSLNSLVVDFVARHKVGGTHLNFFLMKQLAVLAPEAYSSADVEFIAPRVLELCYTAHDLRPFYDDVVADNPGLDPRTGANRGQPFAWDPDRRARLRAELDACIARLYGLSRDELRYILDPADVKGADYPSETFRILRNREIRELGEYRTRRLVLEAWDRLEA